MKLGTNALWFSDIMMGRVDFSLFGRTLDMILSDALKRLVGLNSLTLDWHFVFGIRAIFVWLRASTKKFEFNTFKIILITSSPVTSQYFR